jgi:hypothetical protein
VPPEPSDTAEAVHRLKEEVDQLTLQQSKALRMATLVGMTPEEAQDYDARRKLILKYVQDLAVLEESQ